MEYPLYKMQIKQGEDISIRASIRNYQNNTIFVEKKKYLKKNIECLTIGFIKYKMRPSSRKFC
jgi:hypothetical protein